MREGKVCTPFQTSAFLFFCTPLRHKTPPSTRIKCIYGPSQQEENSLAVHVRRYPRSSSTDPALMGLAMSLMGKMGLPVKVSLVTDKIFEQSFNRVKTFEDFHMAYLDVCNKFNSAMLGQHYEAPDQETIEDYFKQWNATDVNKRQAWIVAKLQEGVKISKTDHSVMTTGLVVPSAAMILKKTGEKIPQVRKFRLDIVPDYIFVPAVTLAAIFGVKVASQRNIEVAKAVGK